MVNFVGVDRDLQLTPSYATPGAKWHWYQSWLAVKTDSRRYRRRRITMYFISLYEIWLALSQIMSTSMIDYNFQISLPQAPDYFYCDRW